MAVTAAAGTPHQPTLGAPISHHRLKTTYSELSRALFSSLLERFAACSAAHNQFTA
jgi:hypothetical protein